jgi:hypothetical protein
LIHVDLGDFSRFADADGAGSEKRLGAAGERRVIGRVYGRVNRRRINRKVAGRG